MDLRRESYDSTRNLIAFRVGKRNDRQHGLYRIAISWPSAKVDRCKLLNNLFCESRPYKFTADRSSLEMVFCAHLSNIISRCYHIRGSIIHKTVKFYRVAVCHVGVTCNSFIVSPNNNCNTFSSVYLRLLDNRTKCVDCRSLLDYLRMEEKKAIKKSREEISFVCKEIVSSKIYSLMKIIRE